MANRKKSQGNKMQSEMADFATGVATV